MTAFDHLECLLARVLRENALAGRELDDFRLGLDGGPESKQIPPRRVRVAYHERSASQRPSDRQLLDESRASFACTPSWNGIRSCTTSAVGIRRNHGVT